jgi:multiple sugar transport system permease protein
LRSSQVYEAAALDNTSRWRSFRHITLPAIRHSVILVAVTQLIAQLQCSARSSC